MKLWKCVSKYSKRWLKKKRRNKEKLKEMDQKAREREVGSKPMWKKRMGRHLREMNLS